MEARTVNIGLAAGVVWSLSVTLVLATWDDPFIMPPGPLSSPQLHRVTNIPVTSPRKLLGSDKAKMGKAFLEAVTNGDKTRVKKLIQKGVNIDYQDEGRSALTAATLAENIELIELLIAEGATIDLPDNNGYTALLTAAYYGMNKGVEALLKAGADPDWIIKSGGVALSFCMYRDLPDTAEIFLKGGANVNIRLSAGSLKNVTPFYLAARDGKLEFVELYLRYGADIDLEVTSLKFQVLTGAALANSEEIIQLLIDNGAEIDHQDIYRWTPLHNAAYYGNIVAVRVLVKNGADKQLENAGGSTPLETLCGCTNASKVASFCQKKECKNPIEIEELLA